MTNLEKISGAATDSRYTPKYIHKQIHIILAIFILGVSHNLLSLYIIYKIINFDILDKFLGKEHSTVVKFTIRPLQKYQQKELGISYKSYTWWWSFTKNKTHILHFTFVIVKLFKF